MSNWKWMEKLNLDSSRKKMRKGVCSLYSCITEFCLVIFDTAAKKKKKQEIYSLFY